MGNGELGNVMPFAFAETGQFLGQLQGLLAYLGSSCVQWRSTLMKVAWLQGTQGTNHPLGPPLPPARSVVPAWSRV